MILDWLVQEGGFVLSWWLLVTLAGIAVVPWCLRLLGGLPDKGYTLARPLGMLLVGFVFWLLASLGFLQNTTGSMVAAWLLVLISGLLAYSSLGEGIDLRAYWRDNKKTIIAAEILFIVLFLGWALFRAYQNDTSTTEKPMDLMFISSIMRSESFPPHDAWMSGFAISYYYFGYLMSAMLSMLSGASSGIGYGLTVALWFALSGLAGFGVVNNLVRARSLRDTTTNLATGILGVVLLVGIGNFQLPLIEMPYQAQSATTEYLDYWGTQARSNGNYDGGYIYRPDAPWFDDPASWSYWWWFRASRVLTDYDLNGNPTPIQPIDEFPQFSFLLGDNHPHVLALPFVIMTLGLALNLVLLRRDPNREESLLYGLAVGGLIFLNTWDGPIYLAVLVGADALRRLWRNDARLSGRDWVGMARFGITLLAIALIAYLPFFIGFRSQAAGLLPNFIYPTLFRRFFIMFGPLLLLTGAYLALEVWRGRRTRRMNWSLGVQVALASFVTLAAVMLLLTVLSSFAPALASVVQGTVNQYGGWGEFLPLLLQRRLDYILTTLVLLVVIALVVARLFARPRNATKDLETGNDASQGLPRQPPTDARNPYPATSGFVLLLVGVAASLTLLPEFVILRDNFGARINTVFKFYYQAWVALSIVSAYGAYSILAERDSWRPAIGLRGAFGVLLAGVLLLGLMYPLFGVYHRAMIESGRAFADPNAPTRPLTLDGTTAMPLTPDDYQAIMCLADLVQGDDLVIVEAERDAYRSYYGRVAAITGIPTVLGWENHERQWRGPTYSAAAGTRDPDINTLYTTPLWDRAYAILERYGIDYVFYGETERRQYQGVGEEKFAENLDLVCDFGDAHVYHVGPDVQGVPR